MIGTMVRRGSLGLVLGLSLASPVLAQSGKDAKKAGATDSDATAAKPAAKKPDDDVVIDNRDMASKRLEEEKQKEKENPDFESDTPFANTVPDPVALREQRWKPGFGGGFRLGFAFPMGDYSGSAKLSDVVDGLIFLGGEAGYWPLPELFLGLALSGGYVLPDCGGDASCAGWQLRGGPEVMVRFTPFQRISPFLGVGAGYEWMTLSASTDTATARRTAHGLELFNIQAGIDVKRSGDFYGMFIAYSLGKFTKESFSLESDASALNFDRSGDIDNPATHSWLGIGARGTME